jgi:hypothetical protein
LKVLRGTYRRRTKRLIYASTVVRPKSRPAVNGCHGFEVAAEGWTDLPDGQIT